MQFLTFAVFHFIEISAGKIVCTTDSDISNCIHGNGRILTKAQKQIKVWDFL